MRLKSVFSLRKWTGLFLESKAGKRLCDEWFVRLEFFSQLGKMPNLAHPQTFNEKLQWLKLHVRDPLHTKMVDKYSAKEYVASIIGEEYIIPTLGVWDRPEEIDFDGLPERFVLKTTHASGGIVLCRDKSRLDRGAAVRRLRRSLDRDYYRVHREWPYKNVPRRIIAEPYLEDSRTGELRDYKFLAFNGRVELMFVVSGRHKAGEEARFDYFDREYNPIPGMREDLLSSETPPARPENYARMVHFAQMLSKGLAHVRVDFYEADGKMYFGELTFFTRSGFIPFSRRAWDYRLGKCIVLPTDL